MGEGVVWAKLDGFFRELFRILKIPIIKQDDKGKYGISFTERVVYFKCFSCSIACFRKAVR